MHISPGAAESSHMAVMDSKSSDVAGICAMTVCSPVSRHAGEMTDLRQHAEVNAPAQMTEVTADLTMTWPGTLEPARKRRRRDGEHAHQFCGVQTETETETQTGMMDRQRSSTGQFSALDTSLQPLGLERLISTGSQSGFADGISLDEQWSHEAMDMSTAFELPLPANVPGFCSPFETQWPPGTSNNNESQHNL